MQTTRDYSLFEIKVHDALHKCTNTYIIISALFSFAGAIIALKRPDDRQSRQLQGWTARLVEDSDAKKFKKVRSPEMPLFIPWGYHTEAMNTPRSCTKSCTMELASALRTRGNGVCVRMLMQIRTESLCSVVCVAAFAWSQELHATAVAVRNSAVQVSLNADRHELLRVDSSAIYLKCRSPIFLNHM